MQTTIVKLYSDGRLVESVAVGDIDDVQARRHLVEEARHESPSYAIVQLRTQVVNRHRYMFAFLEPYKIDFARFVNNLLAGPQLSQRTETPEHQR